MRTHGRGELLVSLCYQPQASRLTAVVLKARNIPRMDMTGLAGTLPSLFLHDVILCYNGLNNIRQILTSRFILCTMDNEWPRRRRM